MILLKIYKLDDDINEHVDKIAYESNYYDKALIKFNRLVEKYKIEHPDWIDITNDLIKQDDYKKCKNCFGIRQNDNYDEDCETIIISIKEIK